MFQKSYIGKTKLNLETRVKEHCSQCKIQGHWKISSSISFLDTQHKVENEAKLLKQAEKPLELIIWEKIFIKKKRNRIQKIHNSSTTASMLPKVFKEVDIKLAPVNKEKVKNLLNMNNKDKIPTEKKSGIYKINHKECQNPT